MLENNLFKYKIVHIFIIVIASFPILVLSNNLWDGVLVNYAFNIDDLSGMKNWFFESRWNLQYYLYLAVYTLSNYINISEEIIIKILVIISLVGISFEIKYLARYLLKLPVKIAYLSSFFVLFYPAWHVLTSSVMVIHILCVWFVLLGFRLIVHHKYRYIGLIILLISLQLNSNFMFLFFLFISEFLSKKFLSVAKPSFKTLMLKLITLIVLFIFYKIQFPAYGLYENYNNINFNLNMISVSMKAVFYYFLFTLPIIILPIFFFLFQMKNYSKKHLQNLLIPLIIISLLIVAAIFPYSVVNKYPYYLDFFRWSYRHTLLLSIPLSLLFGFLVYQVNFKLKGKTTYIMVLISLLIPFTYSFVGYYYKGKSDLYNKAFVYALKNTNLKNEGLVYIKLNQKESEYFSSIASYELSSLFYRAYGKAGWLGKAGYSTFIDEYKLSKFETIELDNKYRKRYCTTFVNSACLINIDLIQHKNVSFLDVLTSNYKDIMIIQIHNVSCREI